jgi:hypothetical protein
MAERANELIAQLRAEVLALQEAATAEAVLVAEATAAAALLATEAAAAEAVLVAQAATTAAAAATAALQLANAAAGLPPPIAFTLAPALSTTAAFRDLTSPSGAKHFKGATECLNSHPFDFSDDSDLQCFLDLVLTKSQVWGWTGLFNIPVVDALTGTARTWNLLSHYGMIPLASVRIHAMTYYSTPTKRAQDSFMVCQCLLNSLTLDFLKTVAADATAYHLPAIAAMDGDVPSGPLLLKLIIGRAHVDSRATVSFLRNSLTQLDAKMIELDSNVVEFNKFVKAQVTALAHRDQESSDLLINLFKGYEAADDVEFRDLVRRMVNDYEEGKDVTVNNLMVATDMKYRARMLNKKWSAPTKEQEQILALTAHVEQLKSSQKMPKLVPGGGKKPPGGKKPKKDNKWAWKDVLPKDGEPRTKLFEGKQYHVNCPYHKDQWVCHTNDECSKNPANATGGTARPPSGERPADPGARRLQRAQLAAALLAEGEESDEGEEADDL